jgi:hypothetical protein
VSEGAKDFIRKLLVVDHRFRLSAKAAQVGQRAVERGGGAFLGESNGGGKGGLTQT